MLIDVLWSGGLDSTYMLQYLSEQGHSVRAGYVAFDNNPVKKVRELAAIEAILDTGFLDQYKIRYEGIVYTASMKAPARNMQLAQPLVWLSALTYMARKDTDALAIGYVMNDDAISFLDDFRAIYASFRPITRYQPDLIFPLTKINKIYIWNEINLSVRDLVTWCESENERDTGQCGHCIPCKRMRHLEIGRDRFEYREGSALEEVGVVEERQEKSHDVVG